MDPQLLQEYEDWLTEHFEELVDQYAPRVVAIHQGQVCMVGDSEAEVYRRLRESGFKEVMPLVLRVPRGEDMDCLL